MTTLLTSSKSSPSATSKIKLIIFDFDGVLADSFDIFYQLNKTSFGNIGLKLSIQTYRDFFNGNAHAGFHQFLKDNKHYRIFQKSRQTSLARTYAKVKLFSFAPPLIKKLVRHHKLAIASSTPKILLIKLLGEHNLRKNFFFVSGNQAYSKEKALRDIIKKAGMTSAQTVMITDTVGDVIVSKKVGLKTIAVTWGFHSRSTLLKAHPDKIVNNFKSLEKSLTLF